MGRKVKMPSSHDSQQTPGQKLVVNEIGYLKYTVLRYTVKPEMYTHKFQEIHRNYANTSGLYVYCLFILSLHRCCHTCGLCSLQLQASLPISAFGLADGVGGWADRVRA